jgi:hypothetical protein
MSEDRGMEFWYKYQLEESYEQSADQMRFIFKVHNYAKEIGDKELNQMCVDYYLMRMEKDM